MLYSATLSLLAMKRLSSLFTFFFFLKNGIVTYIIKFHIAVRVLATTLPSLCTTGSGSTLTTAPCGRRVQSLLQSANLTFCSTCGRSSPFHPLCDVVLLTRSRVPAVRTSMTRTTMKKEKTTLMMMTITTMWNERKRTKRTAFLANESRSRGGASRERRKMREREREKDRAKRKEQEIAADHISGTALRSEEEASSAYRLYYSDK